MIKLTTDTQHSLVVTSGEVHLDGILWIPKAAKGMVIFAHGSGSSHLSTRNQFVAKCLNEASLGTLLFDLLTPAEEEIDDRTMEFRFDIDFLADRLEKATEWVTDLPLTQSLSVGYFGASTGGGAALVAAANPSLKVKAVVSRGGRPDLAGDVLQQVTAPVLLIVGGHDAPVIEMNQDAMNKLTGTKQMEIIPGATHLFEEEGALDEVSKLAKDWFLKYL